MAAPTYVNSGAIASGIAAITPALPASLATDDILLLQLETNNEVISIANQSGGTWTQIPDSPQSSVGAVTRQTIFWSRYNGTQTAPVTSDSGNHQIGRIAAFRGCPTAGDPWDITAATVDAEPAGDTTTVADCLIVMCVGDDWDNTNSTTRFSSWANADLASITPRVMGGGTAGTGGGLTLVTALRAVAGTFGAWTVTTNASIAGDTFITVALKPASGITGADGASAGVASSSVVGAAVWVTAVSSTGTATVTGDVENAQGSEGASAGVADSSWSVGAIWAAVKEATGLATLTSAAIALWNTVFGSTGASDLTGVSVAITAANFSSVGAAIVSGDGEDAGGGGGSSEYEYYWKSDSCRSRQRHIAVSACRTVRGSRFR